MSALSHDLHDLLSQAETDRRRCNRVPMHEASIRIGRTDGVILDLAAAGVKVRHPGALKLGSCVRLSFTVGPTPFLVVGRVLSSKIVRAGNCEQAALFETRFCFSEYVADLDHAIVGM